MFSTSTQRKHWIFSSEEQLQQLRREANQAYVRQNPKCIVENEIDSLYLSPIEERQFIRYWEQLMREFCQKFQPPMTKNVIGTAFQYMKRFYLHNTVMEWDPRNVMVTCVYLACKIEEFNVSILQFVTNVKGDRPKAQAIVLNTELILMQQLRFHLTTHNPYRPVEGFLIDIKTRCLNVPDPERFRSHIDFFIDASLFTDACLLFSPSQIALAAICYAANKEKANLDTYLTEMLFVDAPAKIDHLKHVIKIIWAMIRASEHPPPKDTYKMIEKKLKRLNEKAKQPCI